MPPSILANRSFFRIGTLPSCLQLGIDTEPPFVANHADVLAAVGGSAAVVAAAEGIEIALGADAAAEGDFGEGEGGEAQKVIDKAQSVMVAEIVAGLAGETTNEAGEVAARASKAKGDGGEIGCAVGERLQKEVGGV